MELFLQEIEKALEAGLYFVSLQSTLTLPDICSLLESKGTRSSGAKYSKWFDDNVGKPYRLQFTGEDCWEYRCSLLHSGSSKTSKYSRVIFLVPGKSTVIMHNNVIDNAYNIDIVTFCRQMIEGVRTWEAAAKETDIFKQNYPRLMQVYPQGFSPYISGVPVIT